MARKAETEDRSEELSEKSPGQAAFEVFWGRYVSDPAVMWSMTTDRQCNVWETTAKAAIAAGAPAELAAAMAETRKMRDVACKLLDLFSAPDDRRMRHASVTAATLERYAAEAGVRP